MTLDPKSDDAAAFGSAERAPARIPAEPGAAPPDGRSDAGLLAVRRALAIVNPTSGQRDPDVTTARIVEAFEAAGVEVEVRRTGGEGDARRHARAAVDEGFDLVAAAGGDGTLMEAVEGQIAAGDSAPPIVAVPLGTANGMARTVGLPIDPTRAVEAALAGRVERFDVGRLHSHDRYFLIFAGAGLDAEIVREADRDKKDRFGMLAYVGATLKAMTTRHERRLTVEVDGERSEFTGHTVIAFNASGFRMSGLPVGPVTDGHDGMLDVVALVRSGPGLLAEMWSLAASEHVDDLPLRRARGRRIRIGADPPLPVHADGEPLGETPLDMELLPGAVRLVVPADYDALVARR